MKNALGKSVALFISHLFGHCPKPPTPTPPLPAFPPTSNVESAYNDSGCEGRFKSTLHSGWRGNARICGVCVLKPRQLAWMSRNILSPPLPRIFKFVRMRIPVHVRRTHEHRVSRNFFEGGGTMFHFSFQFQCTAWR